MHFNKFLSIALVISLTAASYHTTVFAEEESVPVEEISIDSEIEEIEIKNTEIVEETDVEITEDMKGEAPFAKDTLDDEEQNEEPEATDEPENLISNIVISTQKNIALCTEDNEIVQSEIEINRCDIHSEKGMTLYEVCQYAFSSGEETTLSRIEKEAFMRLSLPEEFPSDMKIIFHVNQQENKILSVECDY